MGIQTSGQLSLDDIHVEAGGSTTTTAGINDSDIRGLINKSANTQMAFSEWYGASGGLLTTTITVGTWTFKSQVAYGWVGVFNIGSASPTAIPFKNNGNALLNNLNGIYDGASWSLAVTISNVGTDTSNSGFNTLTVNGVSYNRTAANFSVSAGELFYNWPTSSNPVGTTTNGSTFTGVFE